MTALIGLISVGLLCTICYVLPLFEYVETTNFLRHSCLNVNEHVREIILESTYSTPPFFHWQFSSISNPQISSDELVIRQSCPTFAHNVAAFLNGNLIARGYSNYEIFSDSTTNIYDCNGAIIRKFVAVGLVSLATEYKGELRTPLYRKYDAEGKLVGSISALQYTNLGASSFYEILNGNGTVVAKVEKSNWPSLNRIRIEIIDAADPASDPRPIIILFTQLKFYEYGVKANDLCNKLSHVAIFFGVLFAIVISITLLYRFCPKRYLRSAVGSAFY